MFSNENTQFNKGDKVLLANGEKGTVVSVEDWGAYKIRTSKNRTVGATAQGMKKRAQLTNDEIAQANSTARPWKDTLTHRLFREQEMESTSVLDFGAGKTPTHMERLRDLGHDVTGHEFGGNFDPELHTENALDYTYGVVLVSNVLNVQPNQAALHSTLDTVLASLDPDGQVYMNYPASPRYVDNVTAQDIESYVAQTHAITRIGGTKSAPVWRVTQATTTRTAKHMSKNTATCLHCLKQLSAQEVTEHPEHLYAYGQLWRCPCEKSAVWTNSIRHPENFIDYLNDKSPSWAPGAAPEYSNGFCNDLFCGFTYEPLKVLQNGYAIPGVGRGELMGCEHNRIGWMFNQEDEDNLIAWWTDHASSLPLSKTAGPQRLTYLLNKHPEYQDDIKQLAVADPSAPRYLYLNWLVREFLAENITMNSTHWIESGLIQFDAVRKYLALPEKQLESWRSKRDKTITQLQAAEPGTPERKHFGDALADLNDRINYGEYAQKYSKNIEDYTFADKGRKLHAAIQAGQEFAEQVYDPTLAEIHEVYSDDTWRVDQIDNREGAVKAGSGTQWCTASWKDTSYREAYAHGSLYVFQNKQTGEKFQGYWDLDGALYSFHDTANKDAQDSLPANVVEAIGEEAPDTLHVYVIYDQEAVGFLGNRPEWGERFSTLQEAKDYVNADTPESLELRGLGYVITGRHVYRDEPDTYADNGDYITTIEKGAPEIERAYLALDEDDEILATYDNSIDANNKKQDVGATRIQGVEVPVHLTQDHEALLAALAEQAQTQTRVVAISRTQTQVVHIAGNPVICDVADTHTKQAQGLQGSPPLVDGEGMLFPYDKPKDVTFHMGQVSYPIDLIFVSKTTAQKRTAALTALHNLSEHNLEHAAKAGRGLIAPSIAITDDALPFTNFGEITLVAPMDLVDPANTPVFDSDIYSPRYPSMRNEPDFKATRNFQEEYEEESKRTDTYLSDIEDLVTKGGAEELLRRAEPALQLAFLERVKNESVPTIMRDVHLSHAWVTAPAMQQFFDAEGVDVNANRDTPYWEGLSQAINVAVEQWWQSQEGLEDKDAADMTKHERGELLDADGQLSYGPAWSVFQSYRNIGKQEVDRHAYHDHLKERIAPHAEEFAQWASQQTSGITQGQYFYTPGGAKRKDTPENVLKHMKHKTRGGESFDYGIGSIRALGTKRFRNMKQMQAAAKEKLVSADEAAQIKEDLTNQFFELQQALAPYHAGSDSHQYTGALSDALGASYKRSKTLRGELQECGFKAQDIPDYLLEEAQDFLKALQDAPTQYFEAKPQRVVGLHEFEKAIVPVDTSPATLKILQDAGLSVETYTKRHAAKAQLPTVNAAFEHARDIFGEQLTGYCLEVVGVMQHYLQERGIQSHAIRYNEDSPHGGHWTLEVAGTEYDPTIGFWSDGPYANTNDLIINPDHDWEIDEHSVKVPLSAYAHWLHRTREVQSTRSSPGYGPGKVWAKTGSEGASHQYLLLGNCRDFDPETGCSNLRGLPYEDVTEFAQAEENLVTKSREDFVEVIGDLKHVSDPFYLYDEENDTYVLYDADEDIHYFYVRVATKKDARVAKIMRNAQPGTFERWSDKTTSGDDLWRTETSWKKSEEEITLGEVHDHLGDKTVNIDVSDLAPLVRTQKPVDEVSLDYPIIVVRAGGQYSYVLDGNHRLQKAIDQGTEKIKAKILDLGDLETPGKFVRMFGEDQKHLGVLPQGARVAKIIRNAQPGTLERWAAGNCVAVIEVPGGWCDAHNVTEGSTVDLRQARTAAAKNLSEEEGVQLTVTESGTGVVRFHIRDTTADPNLTASIAFLSIEPLPQNEGVYSIGQIYAEQGWGPTIADAALKWVAERDAWLMPGLLVSDENAALWDRYLTSRPDVDSAPLSNPPFVAFNESEFVAAGASEYSMLYQEATKLYNVRQEAELYAETLQNILQQPEDDHRNSDAARILKDLEVSISEELTAAQLDHLSDLYEYYDDIVYQSEQQERELSHDLDLYEKEGRPEASLYRKYRMAALDQVRTAATHRVSFEGFDPEKIQLIAPYIDAALKAIEDRIGQEFDFPTPVQAMTDEAIQRGRKIVGPGHEGGAGHGRFDRETGVVSINASMKPLNILANLIHENLHFALPDMQEVEIDDLTDEILLSLDDGPRTAAAVEEEGVVFDTGRSVTFDFTHKDQPTGYFGDRFGQDIEPHGRYILHGHLGEDGEETPWLGDPSKVIKTLHGTQTFNNPLVLQHGGYGKEGWKQQISDRYNGKIGAELTEALIEDGYDGIVTIATNREGDYVSEILDLTTFERTAAYENCKLYVQRVTGIAKLDDLEPRALADIQKGDVLKWGEGQHWAIYAGDGQIEHVEEWGAEPAVIALDPDYPPDVAFVGPKQTKVAAKEDDLKASYPAYADFVDYLAARDPSDSKKYLDWMFRRAMETHEVPPADWQASATYSSFVDRHLDAIAESVRFFEEALPRLSNKDIYSYRSIEEVNEAVLAAPLSRRQQKQQTKDEGAKLIGQSGAWKVYQIFDEETSCLYGRGTQWCISATESENYYNSYSRNSDIYMAVGPEKFALITEKGSRKIESVWDANDTRLETLWFDAPEDLLALLAQSGFDVHKLTPSELTFYLLLTEGMSRNDQVTVLFAKEDLEEAIDDRTFEAEYTDEEYYEELAPIEMTYSGSLWVIADDTIDMRDVLNEKYTGYGGGGGLWSQNSVDMFSWTYPANSAWEYEELQTIILTSDEADENQARTAGRIEFLQERHPDVDVAALAALDPTPHNEYLQWLVKHEGEGAEHLRQYHDYKRLNLLPENSRDIGQLDPLELEVIVDEGRDALYAREEEEFNKQRQELEAHAQRLRDQAKAFEGKDPYSIGQQRAAGVSEDGIRVTQILDRDAMVAHNLAAGGEWCVGYDHTTAHWDRYHADHTSPVFYVVAGTDPYLLFIADDETTFELRDKHDDAVSMDETEVYAAIKEVLGHDAETVHGGTFATLIEEAVSELISESEEYITEYDSMFVGSLFDTGPMYAIPRQNGISWDSYVRECRRVLSEMSPPEFTDRYGDDPAIVAALLAGFFNTNLDDIDSVTSALVDQVLFRATVLPDGVHAEHEVIQFLENQHV